MENSQSVNASMPSVFSFLFEKAHFKAAYGGRGSGKSHAFATALLLQGVKQPLRILCGREVQKSIKDSVKQLLDDKIKDLGLQEYYHSTQTEIRGAIGTHFIFAGLGNMSISQIKSYEGVDRFWGEEAQTFSERSVEILLPTIRKAGSELWFTWNPIDSTDPIDRLFRGPTPPPDSIVKKVNYMDNPFFPDELEAMREYDQQNNSTRYAHIWLGDYEPVVIGALWTREKLLACRIDESMMPPLERIVVAIDPAITSGEKSDYNGIVVVGLGKDGNAYVLNDASIQGPPARWAAQAISMFDFYEADTFVAEVNQGGDMVKNTLDSVRPDMPVIEVKATRGKHVRAEPASALYAFNRVKHVGTFAELESQMCHMAADKYRGSGSPDRLDALIWGIAELFPEMSAKPAAKRRGHSSELGVSGWMA